MLKNEVRQKSKYRMRICDAPPELLEIIKRSEKKNESFPADKSNSFNVIKGASTSTTNNGQISGFHKIISMDEKRHRFRKNPYPKKSPSKSSPGITLQVDIYSTLKEEPGALFQRSDSLFSNLSNNSSISMSPISQRSSKKKRKERKRKLNGNSLARVMEDCGLLKSHIMRAAEIKSIHIPPRPSMQFDELMKNIDQLNLDLNTLQLITPKISWKLRPLPILHLPHYNSLCPKEAQVVSTLRLTPVQYLTAKYTLISSARRYKQKSLPFRKSDAQKLLKIDVNKASKLWEFFMQVKWI